jgi:hypothetical protein
LDYPPTLPPKKVLSKAIAELRPAPNSAAANTKSTAVPIDFRATISDALELLIHYSLPIYIDNEYGHPELIGTGFIVHREKNFFLVTAKHVYEHRTRGSLYFHSDINIKRHITGTVICSPRVGEEGEDQIDIAVVRLEGGALPPYPGVKRMAVDYGHLSPNRTPRSGRTYVILGYPISKSKVRNDEKNIYVEPTAYYNSSLADDHYPDYLTPKDHIILGWDAKKSIDREGNKIHFPKPQGLSGSPIIELYDTEIRQPQEHFPVVGVATDCRKNEKIMFGSDISFALDMIDSFERITK